MVEHRNDRAENTWAQGWRYSIKGNEDFKIAPCTGIRIPESGKFLIVESGIRQYFEQQENQTR